jgi:hypothetical protein
VLVEYGCRLAISTKSVVHEISHFTLAKFYEKSISLTWAQGKRFPWFETVTQSPIFISIGSTDFLFDPRVNHISLPDATLHKQLISESIHGSSPMISDICPWLTKKFDFSMNASYV